MNIGSTHCFPAAIAILIVSCRTQLDAGPADLTVSQEFAVLADFARTPTSTDLARRPADLVQLPPGPLSKHALLCDGIDDEVSIDMTGDLAHLSAFTIELWFRSDEVTPLGAKLSYAVWAPGDFPPYGDAFNVFVEDINGPRAVGSGFTNGDCSAWAGYSGVVSPRGAWHHLAAEYSATTNGAYSITIFLDGKTTGVGGIEEHAIPACFLPTKVVLCHGPMFTPPFLGAIDDLRLSTVARYDGPFPPLPPASDGLTALLMRFESLPLVDDGPYQLPVTTKGSPQLTTDVHQ